MNRTIVFELDSLDALQIIEAVRHKAQSWRWTEEWLRAQQTGETAVSGDFDGAIEECSDSDEAQRVAQSYEVILARLETQFRAE